jgi:hypothetical protein
LAAKPLFYEYKWPHENIAHKLAHNDDMDLQENTGADEYLNTKQTEHTSISVILVCRSGNTHLPQHGEGAADSSRGNL